MTCTIPFWRSTDHNRGCVQRVCLLRSLILPAAQQGNKEQEETLSVLNSVAQRINVLPPTKVENLNLFLSQGARTETLSRIRD